MPTSARDDVGIVPYDPAIGWCKTNAGESYSPYHLAVSLCKTTLKT